MGTGMALTGLVPACGHGQHQRGMAHRQAGAIGRQAKVARIGRRSALRQFGHGPRAQPRRDAAQGVEHQPTGVGVQRRVCVQIEGL